MKGWKEIDGLLFYAELHPHTGGLVVIGYKTRNEAQLVANELKNSKVTDFWPFNIYKTKEPHENR